MARLELRPTAIPNIGSGAASLLAQAGASQHRAFESAKGLLSSYQEGAQEKVDNEVFSEIAGMNREQLQSWYDSNGLKGRTISKNMRDRLGKQFGTLADVASTRANTARTIAVEADRSAEEVDRVAARTAARGLGPGAAQAHLEGIREGKTGPGSAPVRPGAGVVPDPISRAVGAPAGAAAPAPTRAAPAGDIETGFMGAVSAGYTKKDGTVVPGVKNPHALAAIAATGQHESAFDPTNVNREWQDGKNKAGGVMSWNGKRLKAMKDFVGDDKSPEAQARFLLQENPDLMEALEATTSTEQAMALMDNAWRYKGYNQEGGERASRLATAQGIYGAGAGAAPVTEVAPQVDPLLGLRGVNATSRATSPSPTGTATFAEGPADIPEGSGTVDEVVETSLPRGPNVDLDTREQSAATVLEASVAPPQVEELVADPRKFRNAQQEAIMANPYLTGEQMIAKLDAMGKATDQGEAENLRVEAIARAENLTRIATEWAQDPASDMKLETLQKLLSSQPGTAMEKLNAGLYALELGNGALANVISPNYIKDPAVERGISEELKRNRRSITNQPIHRILNNAKLFGDDDPVKGLQALVKSANDEHAQTPYIWGFFGADATNEDGLRKLVNFIALEAGVSPAEAAAAMADRFTPDPSGFNTNEHRFDKRGTINFLKATLNEESRRTFEGDVERVARREDELNAGGVRLSVMRRQEKKLNDSNSTPQERKDAAQAITALQTMLKGGRTPLDGVEALADYIGDGGLGMANYLKNLEPGSKQHQEAVEFIRTSIESDTRISSAHKRLLFAAIKS